MMRDITHLKAPDYNVEPAADQRVAGRVINGLPHEQEGSKAACQDVGWLWSGDHLEPSTFTSLGEATASVFRHLEQMRNECARKA